MERFRYSGAHVLLSLKILKVLNELLLKALEVWHRLGLAWHEAKHVLERLALRLIVDGTAGLSLKLLLHFMLLHSRGQFRQR